jgi:hypothetical protein
LCLIVVVLADNNATRCGGRICCDGAVYLHPVAGFECGVQLCDFTKNADRTGRDIDAGKLARDAGYLSPAPTFRFGWSAGIGLMQLARRTKP